VFDPCYVPRELYVTGELDAHDVGQLADGRPVFVNTLYNCLAAPSARHSFTPLEAAVCLQDHQGGPLPSERTRHGGRRATLRHGGEQVRHDRKYALVGPSKPRYERFEGLAFDKKLSQVDSEPWCGVQVIDLNTAGCAHCFRIDGPVGELYDVAVVPDVLRPMSLSFGSNEVLELITHDPLDESSPL
jgi:hypothetical protein